jgi:hypothetical protein
VDFVKKFTLFGRLVRQPTGLLNKSTVMEGRKDGGYDVKIEDTKIGKNIFFQFKIPKYYNK